MKDQFESESWLKKFFSRKKAVRNTGSKWKTLKLGDRIRLSAIFVIVVITGYLVWGYREDTISSMLILTGGMSLVQALLDYFEDRTMKSYISVHARLIVVISAFIIWLSKR